MSAVTLHVHAGAGAPVTIDGDVAMVLLLDDPGEQLPRMPSIITALVAADLAEWNTWCLPLRLVLTPLGQRVRELLRAELVPW